jgi:hypothetical protein
MNNYRFSLLRQKGWMRLGMAGAALMIPISMIEHALGFFNDGLLGVKQAVEFASGGAALALILGLLGSWVARGFAVKVVDEDERALDRLPPPRPLASAPHRASTLGRSSALGRGGGQPR